jgi:hypothetical protein
LREQIATTYPPIADDKKKGADDKEVLVDSSNPNKKFWISTDLEVK